MSDRSSGQDPDHKPNPANKGEKKQPKPKSVVQEAWTRLKAATVKLTEADGLELKLKNSGMQLAIHMLQTCHSCVMSVAILLELVLDCD